MASDSPIASIKVVVHLRATVDAPMIINDDMARLHLMETLEKTNPNEASLVRGWQKMHMKNGKWCNQKAKDDYASGIQLMQ
ncbi:hypothetical protein L2E82_18803 [Cichorium intybus]|uniref:Uncharacterized protein n=1 Tax=Cichorium intybus TaxID=13427 RepID=A0ACB9FAC7_CICIN|nr:hypothetical protein L2E82_18803 [Cichorium intybus]